MISNPDSMEILWPISYADSALGLCKFENLLSSFL